MDSIDSFLHTYGYVPDAFHLLGGHDVFDKRPENSLDWIVLIRRGFPVETLNSLLQYTKRPQQELIGILNIAVRTLNRRKREGFFSADESNKLFRMTRTLELAIACFGSVEDAVQWLYTRNPSLEGVQPVTLLDTELGAYLVLATIERINYGVFV